MRPKARIRAPTAIAEYKIGDVAAALNGAAKTLEAAYWSEYCYHAQMEPMNAVAKVSEDGQSAEIWTGTQSNALAAAIVASVLKTTPDKIKIHQHMLGGGYGRRIWPDAAVQAAVLSNVVKKPVKLILTREDDMTAARPRPLTHHVMKAGLDAKGNLTGWYHRLVSENVDAVAAPPRFQATRRQGLHRRSRPRSGELRDPERTGRICPRNPRHACACLARHRRGLQQVRGRVLP